MFLSQPLQGTGGLGNLPHVSFVSGLGRAGAEERSECTPYHQGCTGLLREKRHTCPSCSPPTWLSVQRLRQECMEHSLASKVPPHPCFFFFSPRLRAPAHGQNRGLIFQNMFLARTPLHHHSPPSLAPTIPLLPTIIPLSHSPFPVHHLFSPLPFNPPQTSLPA